jgi:hypothetical protein
LRGIFGKIINRIEFDPEGCDALVAAEDGGRTLTITAAMVRRALGL